MCSRNWECGSRGVKGPRGGWKIGWTQTVKNHEPARSWIHSEGNEGEQARVLNQKRGTLRSHFEGIPLAELEAQAGKRLGVGTQVHSSHDSLTQVK